MSNNEYTRWKLKKDLKRNETRWNKIKQARRISRIQFCACLSSLTWLLKASASLLAWCSSSDFTTALRYIRWVADISGILWNVEETRWKTWLNSYNCSTCVDGGELRVYDWRLLPYWLGGRHIGVWGTPDWPVAMIVIVSVIGCCILYFGDLNLKKSIKLQCPSLSAWLLAQSQSRIRRECERLK